MAAESRHISAELIEEILLGLPVESLHRFSVVSKSWHSLIFSPTFARRQKSITSNRAAAMITTIPDFGDGVRASTRPLSSIRPDQIIGGADDGEPLFLPFRGEYSDSLRILASCGDLWCTLSGSSLFLWNPSIRTFRKLHSPPSVPHYMSFFVCYFGLGYDPASDDYKVLKFEPMEAKSHVYSLRSDMWKETEAFPGQPFYGYRGEGAASVAGALHWLARADSHERVVKIISFDLLAEKYAEVPMLPLLHGDTTVSVLRGKLCVAVRNYTSGVRIDVYVMEEYGVGESWAKVYEFECIPPSFSYFSHDESGVIGLIWIRRVGDDARLPKALICADHDDEIIRVLQCSDGYNCHLYTASLVFPDTYCATPRP